MGRAGRKEEWSTSCHPYTHCICPACLSVCMCQDVSISLHAMFSDIVFLCAYVPVCVCVSPFLCLRLVLFSRCPSLSLCLQVCGSVPGSFSFAAFVSGRIIVCLLVFLSPRLRLCMSGSVTAPIQSIKHHLHVMSCCCCCFYVCCCSRYHW